MPPGPGPEQLALSGPENAILSRFSRCDIYDRSGLSGIPQHRLRGTTYFFRRFLPRLTRYPPLTL